MVKKYNAISLFSGMGGDTLGMINAGCNVIGYSEINPLFCETHELNLKKCELIGKDVKGNIVKTSDEEFEKYNKKVDIIFAGFPCQSFSNAGKKQATDSRGQLFKEFVRATKIIEPTLIIGENVTGLLSRKTTTGEKFIDIIVEEFEKIGYEVIYDVFKLHEYGVPQKRERMLLIGVKKNNKLKWTPQFPEPLNTPVHLKDIVSYNMSGAVEVDEGIFENIPDECILTGDYSECDEPVHPYLLSKVDPKDTKTKTRDEQLSYDGKTYENLFSFGKRISPIHCEIVDIRKPSKTIICSYDHQPRLYVPLKNEKGCFIRPFLVDELKQIQGFPKDFKMVGNWKQKVTQIGNAVPPQLICEAVKKIIKK